MNSEEAMRSSVKQLLRGRTQVFQIRKNVSIRRSYCAQAQETGDSEGGRKKWEVPVEDADEERDDAHLESSSVLKGVKQHFDKEIKTAKDMAKNIPEKTKETKEEIKDLGGVAAEAAKRDLHKVAQKVGLLKDD